MKQMPRVYMPQRLSSDVDQAEQAEQQRLEDGWDDPTPSPGENVRSEEASPGGSVPTSGGAVQSERVVLPESVGSRDDSPGTQRQPVFARATEEDDSDAGEFGVDTELPVPPTYPEQMNATIKNFVKNGKKIMAGRNGIVTYQTGWKGYNSWHMRVHV